MDLVETVMVDRLEMFELEIASPQEMGSNEGETCPSGTLIRLREDVYIKACAGEGRARFTVAHELGHWHMHTGVKLARSEQGERVPGYMASEPQANQYAAELLMPLQFFKANDTPMEVMMRHGVSASAAQVRLDYLMRKGLIK
jgi:Zn-dependent peptidase ImmA (M78 family)